ncbi:hypothetical protein [Bifidobacterium pseudolongum]|uniref:hypothetical protein n=1 Tax=Bifidobacterium pseudolongum TaxID=1694 RepID=UPI001F0F5430|nr:hypothetical protein [Bifidobacterium pseudolongum]MCH4855710.1 hypothetical protein [Bifidobacterium pseudolongum]
MTMRDILDLSDSCLGFAVNNIGDELPAVLHDTGDQIELSILKHDNGRAIEMFAAVANVGKLNAGIEEEFGSCIEVKADYEYTLIDRERSSYGASSDVGVDTIVSERVVAGIARKDFDTIDGMLTSMDGLSQWLGLSRFQWEREGLKQTITVGDTPATEMWPSAALGYGQKWFIQPHYDSVVAANQVHLRTLLPNESWSEHLHVHGLISDLMSVADCRTHGYRDMKVYKATPNVGLPEEVDWNEWHDVLSYNPIVDRNACDRETKYLFSYGDLPKGSIAKWDELRDGCAQGMAILLHLIRELDNMTIETGAVLVGIMLEYVGKYIERSNIFGKTIEKSEGSNEEPEKGFKRLMTLLLKCFRGDVPLADPSGWKDRMRRAYIGNKHPDAKKATLGEMRLAVMESMVLVRMWVGMQVGADLKKMKDRLVCDKIGCSIRSHLA